MSINEQQGWHENKAMKRAKMCCSNRSSGVYALNQGHMT